MIARRDMLRGGLLAAATALSGRAIAMPVAKIMAARRLQVAVYKDFEPWAWRDGDRLTGIDVEIGKLLADGLGVAVDYQEILADESVEDDLRNAVWRGSLVYHAPADVMMHVPVDRAFALQNDRVVIFGPYFRESFAMVCDRDVDCEAPPAQLKGRRLAAEIDSIPDFYLIGSFGGVLRGDVQHVPSGHAAVAAVVEGRADAAVATRAQAEHGIASHKDGFAIRKSGLPMMTTPGWDVGVAVKDDSRDLADRLEPMIARLQADGTIAAICARYGVSYRPPLAA